MNIRIRAWVLIASLMVMLNVSAQPGFNLTVFVHTDQGVPVEGIDVAYQDDDGDLYDFGVTDSVGKTVMPLAPGEVIYLEARTSGMDDFFIIGGDSIPYFDMDGDSEEGPPGFSYNVFFVSDTAITINANDTAYIVLPTTTIDVSGEALESGVEVLVKADYASFGGFLTEKYITAIYFDTLFTSLSLPLPILRSEFDEYFPFSDFNYVANGLIAGDFNTGDSVDIEVSNPRDVIVKVITDKGDAVGEMVVELNQNTNITDSSGCVGYELLDGTYLFNLYTEDEDEMLIIGGEYISYFDYGGENSGFPSGKYDNIFAVDYECELDGEDTIFIVLPTVTFDVSGEALESGVEVNMFAEYYNAESDLKSKLLTSLEFDTLQTSISVPLPVARTINDDVENPVFFNYSYNANNLLGGNLALGDTVELILGALRPIVFEVKTDEGIAVEGIIFECGAEGGITDPDGFVSVGLMDGEFLFNLYTVGDGDETLIIGTDTITYYDFGGDNSTGSSGKYDNIFLVDTVSIFGEDTIGITLMTTSITVTGAGLQSGVMFEVLGDYINPDGSLKTKTLTVIEFDTTMAMVNLLLPMGRTVEDGADASFDTYAYVASGVIEGEFDLYTDVDVEVGELSDITFVVKTETDSIVEGALVSVGSLKGYSDEEGEVMLTLPSGMHYLTVALDEESWVIGGEYVNYSRYSQFDQIFIIDSIDVLGDDSIDLSLPVTTFITTIDSMATSLAFELLGSYTRADNSEEHMFILHTSYSDDDGIFELPIPMYRLDEQGNMLTYSGYIYYDDEPDINGGGMFFSGEDTVFIEAQQEYPVIFSFMGPDSMAHSFVSTSFGDFARSVDFTGLVTDIVLVKGDYSYIFTVDGVGQTNQDFTVTGVMDTVWVVVGSSPILRASNEMIEFADVALGVFQDVIGLDIGNDGDAILTITDILITGEDSLQFSIDTAGLIFPLEISSFSSVSFDVIFDPSVSGDYMATVEFVTAEVGTHVVDLQGIGYEKYTLPFDHDFETGFNDGWRTAWSSFDDSENMDYDDSDWYFAPFGNQQSGSLSAYFNLYNDDDNDWLMTPTIDLGAGNANNIISFDIAFTDYYNTSPASQANGSDDKFLVIISTDGGDTWSAVNTLRQWDNAGSAYVLNQLSNVSQTVEISLAAYSGEVAIAFYAESTIGNSDNDLFIDNLFVGANIVTINPSQEGQLAVSVYPNPVDDVLFINAGEACQVELVSAAGQTLISTVCQGSTTLDMSALGVGLYLVVIEGESGRTIEKVVKQ